MKIMKTVLVVVAPIVAVGVALGFYLRWFRVSSRNHAGTSDIALSMDKKKIKADKTTVLDKLKDSHPKRRTNASERAEKVRR